MRSWERKGWQKNKNNSPLPVRWTFWESSTTCEFLLLLFVDFFKKSFVVPYKITLSLCIPPSYTPLMKEMNAEASWRYAFVFSFMVGDSKVPRISTITTLKFSQSILIFKILSRKRAIYRELKKQRRRRCVYVSKASSSLFVDYINRKKERMAERIQESMEGVTKGYIGDLVWKFFPSLRQGRSQRGTEKYLPDQYSSSQHQTTIKCLLLTASSNKRPRHDKPPPLRP